MKNNIWFVIACVLVFFVGYNVNDVAVSFPRYKVAVVDVSTLLSNSSEIKSLKISQDRKMEEINTLISKAQNEIINEKDKSKIMALEQSYRKQIEDKRHAMDDEYNEKVAKINEQIKTLISKEAQKEHYNLVLPTGMVISGGDDITKEVIKNVK